MDEDLHTDGPSGSHSTGNVPYAGAFFPNSRNLVVEGGIFTSNVTNITHNHHTYPVEHDFRKIPMGEIDLQREIRLDQNSGIAYRRRGQRSSRRMYSARIDGCKSAMTVAWYQGPDAEQGWHQVISMHSWLRHPNFVQLYGVASTGYMHATVFHGDLIPLEQFKDIHCNSLILSTYFRAYWAAEFDEMNAYLWGMFKRSVNEDECTLWIRGGNRRLCVNDMIFNDDASWSCSYLFTVWDWTPGRKDIDIISYNGPNHEAVVVSSLALSQYYKFCRHNVNFSWPRRCSLPAHATATIGMVVKNHPSDYEIESPVNIAFMPLLDVGDKSQRWNGQVSCSTSGGCGPSELQGTPPDDWLPSGYDLMPDSWRRYNLHQIYAISSIDYHFSFNHLELWLSQANHIFSSLQITSDHDQYVVVNSVQFQWVFTPTTHSSCPSQGWLFLCPNAQLRYGPCSFRWPDCAAYWSRDPFGAVRLSTEEAEEAGFPLIKLELLVSGMSWDSSDYAGLWRFHQGKGFAPDSQDIARHLGHPLYQLCDEITVEAPFAHVNGEDIDSDEDNTDQHNTRIESAMSEEFSHETVASEHDNEEEEPGSIQADILLPSTHSRLLFKLPTAILILVVLCCLADTAY